MDQISSQMTNMENARVLVTWDLDGTIMLCGNRNKVHGDSVIYGIKAITGVEKPLSWFLDNQPVSGCSDRYIAELACIKTGTVWNEQTMDVFMKYAESFFVQTFDGALTVLPGVKTVLSELAKMPNVTIGICSGNPPGIGWRKLECAGLRCFFTDDVAGWGIHADRSDMLKSAIEQGEAKIGCRFDRIIHVGDAPQDADAAVSNGVIGVILKTARYKDHVFPEGTFVLENLDVCHDEFIRIVQTGK